MCIFNPFKTQSAEMKTITKTKHNVPLFRCEKVIADEPFCLACSC